MTSEELADEVKRTADEALLRHGGEGHSEAGLPAMEYIAERRGIVADAQSRVLGIGHEQYAQEPLQRFETVDFGALFVLTEEELLDQINYAVMGLIRLRRLKAAWETGRVAMADEYDGRYAEPGAVPAVGWLIAAAYAAYDSDSRVNGPDDLDAFTAAVLPLLTGE